MTFSSSREPRLLKALAILAVHGMGALAALGAERPNIVFFFCDDLRSDALGYMGHPFAHTPHLDGLSARGVTFHQAFATTAICITSRANVLTGQYAAKTGLRHGDLRKRALTREELDQTYLVPLAAAGYRMGYVGKWHCGEVPKGIFDYNAAFDGQGQFLKPDGSGTHLTRQIGDHAIEMIREDDGRPFFLCVGFKAPHVQDSGKPSIYPFDRELTGHLYRDTPIPRPALDSPSFFSGQPDFIKRSLNRQRWEQRFSSRTRYETSVRGYFRLVSGVDHAVGRVLAALKDTGKDRETVIVFASDHGVYLGARGLAGKWLPHEPSIRIPLVVYDPRSPVSSRGSRDAMVLTIDLAPTFLDLAGVPVPDAMQGRSLVPLLEGSEVAGWRTSFFYEHHFAPHMIPATEAVRTERWKYIRYLNSDPLHEELYDLQSDPLEERNLIGSADYEFIHQRMEQTWEKLKTEAQGKKTAVPAGS